MPRYLRVAAMVATLLLLYLAWKFIVPEVVVIIKCLLVIMIPFLLAAVISVFIEPWVNFFQQRLRLTRPLSVAAIMFLLIGGFGLIVTLSIFRLVAELSTLSVSLPKYILPVQGYINQIVERGRFFYFQLPPVITDRIQENLSAVTNWLSDLAGQTANFLLHTVSVVPGVIMVIVFMLVALYFISRDRKIIVQFWLRYIPSPWGEHAVGVGREVTEAFIAYVRAQFILILITTLISIVGLQIIGANYALTVGLLVGFFDLLPVLGPSGVYLPWAIWAFAGGNPGFGLKLVALYIIVYVVRQMLEARIVAANLGLHPLAVLVAMYIGFKAMGVAGLILGPILLITILAGIKAYLATRHK